MAACKRSLTVIYAGKLRSPFFVANQVWGFEVLLGVEIRIHFAMALCAIHAIHLLKELGKGAGLGANSRSKHPSHFPIHFVLARTFYCGPLTKMYGPVHLLRNFGRVPTRRLTRGPNILPERLAFTFYCMPHTKMYWPRST